MEWLGVVQAAARMQELVRSEWRVVPLAHADMFMTTQAPPAVAAGGEGGGGQVRDADGLLRRRNRASLTRTHAWCVRSFHWKIPDWRAFQADATNRTYGAAFSAGGFSWRLLLFPRGNTVPFLSLYLAVTSDFQQRLPPGWAKFARFALIVPNRVAPSLVKMTQHQFDRRAVYCCTATARIH